MEQKKITIERDKKIALVAHDNKKPDLVEWAKYNRDLLAHHTVYATGTTGALLERELGFPVLSLKVGRWAAINKSEQKLSAATSTF